MSEPENWSLIAQLIQDRLAEGFRVLVVHSALSGVSDALAELATLSTTQQQDEVLEGILEQHRRLASQLGVDVEAQLGPFQEELVQLNKGVQLIQDLSPKIQARLLSMGELMATRLGAGALTKQGLSVDWLDARDHLRSRPDDRRSRANYLSAQCDSDPDPRLQELFGKRNAVLLTQGFVARSPDGETVLLGRGGSDTSAAYFAALLEAKRLEIWTDVPGMFSANPQVVSSARLLRHLDYREAQELASTGSTVLHPRCIAPVERLGIPLHIRSTSEPELSGTVISAQSSSEEAQVKAVSFRPDLLLISMEGIRMWHQPGFLADAFACFKDHGISIDLVSTSESNVTVSVDSNPDVVDRKLLEQLVTDLSRLCQVEVIENCASVSLVGRKIRTILHELGPAMEVFQEHKIYLVSQAASDLNFTFVVEADQVLRLVKKLHSLLIRPGPTSEVFGDSWEERGSPEEVGFSSQEVWWVKKRAQLLGLVAKGDSLYVYDSESLTGAFQQLKSLESISRIFYSVKANANSELLQCLEAGGSSFECVSPGELQHVFGLFPKLDPKRVLFTPNFAPREDYDFGLKVQTWITLDNLHPLKHWPDLFRGRELLIRVDPGLGRGHHQHVRTGGIHSKFGIPQFELDEARQLIQSIGAQVIGLHAHCGSGILDWENWRDILAILLKLAEKFPDVRILDIGGGFGIPEKAAQPPLDLKGLDSALSGLRENLPGVEIWIEPGRFLAAQAGALLTHVTQVKGKGSVRYVGVTTGMNSLIRPALYGAYHPIVNLTRLEEPATEIVQIVGPICETGDILGRDRLLPRCQEGDVILIANAGAYGRVMSSHYNLRAPAEEVVI